MMATTSHCNFKGRRIGLFGGTFNPIHNGHLAAAGQVRRLINLDRIYFIPCSLPPHKPSEDLAPGRHRLAMVQLALASRPDMVWSDIELQRPGPSYTIDTLQMVRAVVPTATEIFLILGLDAFLSIHKWKKWPELMTRASLAVMSRPGQGAGPSGDMVKLLETYLHSTVSLDYNYDPGAGCFQHPAWAPVCPLAIDPLDVSSSRIRQSLKKGLPVKKMVPEAVAAYIRDKGLYQ